MQTANDYESDAIDLKANYHHFPSLVTSKEALRSKEGSSSKRRAKFLDWINQHHWD